MSPVERDRFDRLVEEVIRGLPASVRRALDEVPIVVLDKPTPDLLEGIEDPEVRQDPESLCGLHTGHSITDRSIEHSGELPSHIHLFRIGIVSLAGGWNGPDADAAVAEEIRVTILHELGHEMGLDEDDLYDLGYD
ncbi:MAG: metallopeptidase family protein [Phycisphaeraceae bacterium]|nr:metallopeptidase family protein [Phycisphaeraceae bacterium]MCW5769814.1 metallopeptidase family protein [Phycisphaeraceae bacterium]